MQNALSKTMSLVLSLFLAISLIPIVPAVASATTNETGIQTASQFVDQATQDEGGSNGVGEGTSNDAPQSNEELEASIDSAANTSEELEVATAESVAPAMLSANDEISALATGELTLNVTYTTPRCGSPMTFTSNATGGSLKEDGTPNLQYRVGGLFRYDNGALSNMGDISYNMSFPYDDSWPIEKKLGRYLTENTVDLTFYSSGKYEIWFYVMDMQTYAYVRQKVVFEINDPSYPNVEQKVQTLAQKCLKEAGATDYDRALWLHDYLINNNIYDPNYFYCDAEGVLGRGRGTCEAFVTAYHKLLGAVGIACERIESKGGDMHVWSNVRLDGKWYEIDVTWDCTPTVGSTYPDVRHLFFGLNQDITKLVRRSYTGTTSGNVANSLDQNYFIKSREILKYSDAYRNSIQAQIDAKKSSFSLDVNNAFWPDNYKNIINNLVAYELSNTSWTLDGKDLSVKATYANNVLNFDVGYPVEISVDIAKDENTVKITAIGTALESATAVQFPTWSSAGGQDDIVWYGATKQGNAWVATVDIKRYHKTAGTYAVHCYATVGGSMKFVDSGSFTISTPTANVALTQSEDQKKDGKFTTTVSNIVSPSGVQYIQSPTWSAANGQDDIDWSNMSRVDATTYERTHSCVSRNRDAGTYNSHVYLMAGNGIYVCVGTAALNVEIAPATMEVNPDKDEMHATVKISGGLAAYASAVQFPTWSSAGGQDDIVWYGATKQGNAWVATVDIKRYHKTAGTYAVHCYATVGGALKAVGTSSFNISTPKANVALTQSEDQKKDGKFTTTVTNIVSPSGVQYVQSPTWSAANGQDDIDWSNMSRVDATNYTRTHSCISSNRDAGTYNSHVYLMAGNGIYVCVGTAALNVEIAPATMEVNPDKDEMHATVKISGGLAAYASAVQFPTWSSAGGQDDIVWYGATKQGNAWVATVDIKRYHRTAGTYLVHCYATVNGSMKFVDGGSFEISHPTADVDVQKTSDNSFRITISNVDSPSGVANFQTPTWTTSNQSDIIWYGATSTDGKTWTVDVSTANHQRGNTEFKIHTYITANNGVFICVNAQNFSMAD